jgi:hypothetical protein
MTLTDRKLRRLNSFTTAASRRGNAVYTNAVNPLSLRVVLHREKCLHEVLIVEFPPEHLSGKTFNLKLPQDALTAFHNGALDEFYLLPPALDGREISLQVLREFYSL